MLLVDLRPIKVICEAITFGFCSWGGAPSWEGCTHSKHLVLRPADILRDAVLTPFKCSFQKTACLQKISPCQYDCISYVAKFFWLLGRAVRMAFLRYYLPCRLGCIQLIFPSLFPSSSHVLPSSSKHCPQQRHKEAPSGPCGLRRRLVSARVLFPLGEEHQARAQRRPSVSAKWNVSRLSPKGREILKLWWERDKGLLRVGEKQVKGVVWR